MAIRCFQNSGPEEIDRLRRFGEVWRYAVGDLLFVTGEPSPEMFVLIAGTVAVSARDGLGHVVPIVEEGPREFSTMNLRVFQNIFICVASLILVAALGVFPAFAKDSGSKTFDHVYVIVLENYGFDDALYNGPSPFLRRSANARKC